ncbi:hypothetical protein ABMA27_008146 [Loxostege sticticalis]|uniref:C2 domain-containing protein n=1 Tax=Loxostege sticticalis TaxID=481309 RepID=A0ABR3HE42_LOXSC
MPGKIKVKVLAGRNLPVMDRAGDTTDAFVEIKFGGVTHKTDVCRKSLNPQWNSTEWYRFEVDESELQDEPLQLRLMDHDTYSANDAIGKVVISLAPLLAREANNTKAAVPPTGAVMSGWIPVFDTMHGIRGELNVIVKVELFSDFNKYKTSSCGVQFFHCPMIPPGYRATSIHGFVEELVVNDDPEYQWIDKIRTPRASNEARQVAFINLSNQVQRLVGLKAAELGANAVVGYQQDFDLEGEAGVVARAIGTAVSITPVPPPSSQATSMPPCTQQQLRKCLDILATNDESVTDLNQYYQHHQDELQKLLTILNPKGSSLLDETDNVEDDDKSILTRQSSIKSYAGSVSIYQDDYVSQKSLLHIAEDQSDLNRLLNRGDDDSDSPGPLKNKIKKFKTSFFLKRLNSMRSSRKSEKQDDTISIKSNSSDTSRISLVDIKNEIKKFKRMKKPKFRKTFANPEDQGVGMASILARSVMHAHTSLACIAETQDSEHSPNSTLRRTSESEPTINIDEVKPKVIIATISDASVDEIDKKNVPEVHFASLKNISSEGSAVTEPHRKLSESCPNTPVSGRNNNLLKLPGEVGYFGSVSSALSGDSSEIYTSSDEDYESSDQRTDNEKSFETTSSVVRYVMNNKIDPTLIAHMEKKLGNLEVSSNDTLPKLADDTENVIVEAPNINAPPKIVGAVTKNEKEEAESSKHQAYTSTSSDTDPSTFVAPKPNNHQFKFHNPFAHHKKSKSISAPCSPVENKSFVYRSSKRIKRQLSKLSNNSMIKSLSHYSLLPKKKVETKTPMSQPGSSSDVTSKAPSDTVLGSPFLSYADLLSLDKEDAEKNKLHKSSEDFHRGKVSMYIGSEPVSRASLSGTLFPENANEQRRHSEFFHKKDKPVIKPTGLVHTAMETILIDKVQSLLIPTSPEPAHVAKQFFDDVNEKLEKVEEDRNSKAETTGLVYTAMETMLMDKVKSLIGPKTPESSPTNTCFDDAIKERHILNNPDETSNEERKSNFSETASHKEKRKDSESSGLVHTAMETILMDKVKSLMGPTTPDCSPTNKGFDDAIKKSHVLSTPDESSNDERKSCTSETASHNKRKDSESSGLTHTAMETILLDKVQSLFTSPISFNAPQEHLDESKDKRYEPEKPKKEEPQTGGLINTAVQTILMEKVQSLIDPSVVDIDDSKVAVVDEVKSKPESSLTHKTMESIIVDKVQSIFHKKSEKDAHDHKSKAPSGLVHSAMETMLIDTVQSLLPECEEEDDSSKPKLEASGSKDKRLVRQDSVRSDTESPKMSSDDTKRKQPVLQHFHPLLSGAPLETIPSLPESFDRTESLDVEGVERDRCETNSASVCGNSHAACGVDRSEREKDRSEKEKGSPRHARHESYGGREPVVTSHSHSHAQNASLNSSSTPLGIHRRSSDSDLSVTPKGSSLNTSAVNTGSGGGAILRPSMNSNNLEMLEYPFLTMTEYPPGFIVHIGGTVCARSVKLVDGGGESAARAAWWAELRTELRAHARALRCNAVIAYTDTTAICEDVCVLSASGTAAVINLDCDFNAELDASISVANGTSKGTIEEVETDSCSVAHVPYSPGTGPYRAELSTCGGCRRARVPAVLLATCSKPSRLASYPKAVTLTAVAARTRRAPPASEPGARDISDQLPFLEYELHKLLLAKLRMQGANALFNLQTQIAIGERCVMALASGTAVRLTALPPPAPPRIKATENDKEALEIQKALWDSFTANKTANGFDAGVPEHSTNGALPELEGEEPPALDLCADKDACVLELDEAEDVETARGLARRGLHTRMQVFTSALAPARSAPPYAFVQAWRGKVQGGGLTVGGVRGAGERQVGRALDALAYKLRRLQPAALLTTSFRLDLPEDEIQLVVSGTAVRLQDPSKPDPTDNGRAHGNGTGDADDDIFALDEEQLAKSQHSEPPEEKAINGQVPTTVSLTSLCYIAGARVVRRVCALRLLFVRETTTVRELGGLSGFLHTFTCEVLAIARAYTAALGGNALTSFYITQLMLQDNAHKNQGQCLLSVGGDVVHITY